MIWNLGDALGKVKQRYADGESWRFDTRTAVMHGYLKESSLYGK